MRSKASSVITNALLALGALVVGLTLAEGAIRWLNTRLYPEPLYWVNHPVLGVYRRPLHRYRLPHNEDYRGEFETDADGVILRDSLDPSEADVHVMFLGDSMLDGQAVAPNDNLTEVFARRLREQTGRVCRCVNLGISGSSPARYLLAYRFWRERVRPDLVVLLLYVLNDFNDDARLHHGGRLVYDAGETLTAVRPTFDCRRGTFWGVHAGIHPMPRRENLSDCGGLRSLQLLRRTRAAYLEPLGPVGVRIRRSAWDTAEADLVRDNVLSIFKSRLTPADQEDVTRTLGWIEDTSVEAAKDGARLVVVVLPTAGQIPGELAGVEEAWGVPRDVVLPETPHRWVSAALDARGLPHVDLLPLFLDVGAGVAFGRRDKHFSAAGHRLVGEFLADHLAPELQGRFRSAKTGSRWQKTPAH
jgi:hypothetical protein